MFQSKVNFTLKIKKIQNQYFFYCPGCKSIHSVNDFWIVDLVSVSINPSILTNGKESFNDPLAPRCHLFIRNGKLVYLCDCTHEYANMTVEMIDVEEFLN